jgi:hypothetical protein
MSLNRNPSHERLERLTLLGEWHLNAGHASQAKECFEAVLKVRPDSKTVKALIQEADRNVGSDAGETTH